MAITASSSANTSTPNVTRFPSKLSSQQQNRDDHYDNYYNNNNNIACARAREAEARVEDNARHGDFAQAYADALSRPMPKFVEREIRSMLARGIDGGLIIAAIEYTAAAPQPSWAYARAVILRNWARGINSEEDFLESLEART